MLFLHIGGLSLLRGSLDYPHIGHQDVLKRVLWRKQGRKLWFKSSKILWWKSWAFEFVDFFCVETHRFIHEGKNVQKHETQLLWIQPINMLPGSFQSKSLIKAEKHQAHDIHWDEWFCFLLWQIIVNSPSYGGFKVEILFFLRHEKLFQLRRWILNPEIFLKMFLGTEKLILEKDELDLV